MKFKKGRLIGAILLIVIGLAVIIVNLATTVKPEWPEARAGDSIPAKPAADDPPFNTVPFADTYQERREAFLEWVSELETPNSRGGVWTDLAKLEYNPNTPINQNALEDALAHVNSREDTADFTMSSLVRLYYKHAGRGILTQEQEANIKQAMLDFKYWLDEPNPSPMELWTENHQILVYTSEYLAGQLFPEETFTNNGQSGEWHRQAALQRINKWIDFRSQTGMAEWDSVVYYPMDISALLNLVDFSEDLNLADKAAMMVDLLLFDIAVDNYYGQYATSNGRTKADTIKSAAGQSMLTLQNLAWGLGRFQSIGERASISLATSERYQIPPVIISAAQDNPDEYSNYERQSIPVTDEAVERYGLNFEDIDDMDIWWGMGAFTHPKVIELTVNVANSWDLWHYPDFRDLKDIGQILGKLGLLPLASAWLDPDPNGVVCSEVNKVTFRTPDYQLSSAQDYRKGEKGYQQHIFQATLDPYAVIFVNNPDSLREDDKHRPSYWSSNGRMPRTGQFKNVLIALWDIDRRPSPAIFEARHYAFTHAYFPRWAFDEVIEVPAEDGGGWIFGRVGDGYIALYSHQPYEWQTEGPDAGQEIIALGWKNVWIINMGRKVIDGDFDQFMNAVSTAPLIISGLNVTFHAPGVGRIDFGWDGPFTVEGTEVPLRDYPRWRNPYTLTEFDSNRFVIEHEGESLIIDFSTGERIIE